MTPLQLSIRSLREVCADFNIHTLRALESALYLGNGLTQQEIADKTGQTRQAEGRWETWMELNGLVSISKEKRGRTTSYTASGEKFIQQLKTILCQGNQAEP